MSTTFRRLLSNRSGATAIEYGLIASIICTILVAALMTLSPSLSGLFTRIATALGG